MPRLKPVAYIHPRHNLQYNMNNQFNDSFLNINLPPLYKGNTIETVPGRSQRRQNTGLRRYIFRYENNQFTYLATQLGQRNGGNDATNPGVNFEISVPGYVAPGGINYDIPPSTYFFAYSSPTLYVDGVNSKLVYTSGRWEWQTRAQANPPLSFTTQAYSSPTSNSLVNAGTINQIDWFYTEKDTPIDYPATVTITNQSFYNNDSVYKMNLWPIQNKIYKSASGQDTTNPLPTCVTQGLLQRCFQGVSLKSYEVVFIEVNWIKINFADTTLRLGKWGRRNSSLRSFYTEVTNGTDNYCWWVPNTVNIPEEKGRIYRIGKLKEYNGNGKTDVVTWAQFTQIRTTRTNRGGNNVFK